MLVRAKREKTAKRGNSQRNINGRHESKLKRAIVLFPRSSILFLPAVFLLFPAETIGLVSFTLPVPLLSRRDFRNYEAIYIQMPVSNGHSREPLSTSVSSYRSVSFFRLFSPISPFPRSSTRLVSLTKAPVIKQVSRLDVSR